MFYFILRVSSVNKILEIELFREDIHQKLALCKFWQHWSTNFCFCQREPELPRFFISCHNSIKTELYHRAYFNLILHIPRPLLSL